MYFVITTTSDGIRLETMDKELLLQQISSGDVTGPFKSLEPGAFIDLTEESATFIIKGESITPKPVKVVERYEV